MKQTLFMVLVTIVGTFGAFVEPFLGVAVYYFFAVLRPQYIWIWALPQDVRWSMYVALGTLAAMFMNSGSARTVPAGTPATPGRAQPGWFGPCHKAMLLFASWVVLTYFTAQNRDASWPWLQVYLKLFLMFFVSAFLIRTLRHVWILLIVSASALGYIAYEVNFMYLASGYMGIYFNGYGGMDNNGAGLMLAIGIPMCIFVYMGTGRWWRWIFAALVPILLHAVLMTYSRGAMVALLVATPVIFLRGRNKFQLLLAAVAIAAIIPILAGPGIRARFFSINTYEDESSARLRFASWEAAYRISRDYPILGVGVRNANLFSAQYGADMVGRTIHSQYLQVLADNGYPGLLFYVSTLGAALISLRRVRRWSHDRDDSDGRMAYATACGIESGLAVFCVGSLFLSLEVFELPYVLLLLGAQLPLVLEAEGLMGAPKPVAPAASVAPPPARFNAARARAGLS
ncbi:MAG: O-antigen ligase family protein [Vicinamibacterales bacterium]